MKIHKNALLIVALIAGTIGFTNCGGDTKTATNNSNTTVANAKPATTNAPTNSTTPANTTTPANNEVATTGDKVGVPECDEYIEKYEACLNSKVPEAQRAMYKSSFETMRKSWKEAAANPQAKAALATGCKQAMETAKTALGSYACTW